jgi:hypothetical protein
MSTIRPETMAGALRRAASGSVPLKLEVQGSSMRGTILPGSLARIVAGGLPRRGEIWAFCDPQGNILVHRYRARKGGLFIFQGDSRVRADPPVGQPLLIGRVISVEERGRTRSLSRWDRLPARLKNRALGTILHFLPFLDRFGLPGLQMVEQERDIH